MDTIWEKMIFFQSLMSRKLNAIFHQNLVVISGDKI